MMKTSNSFVTGSSGLIGSRIIKLLCKITVLSVLTGKEILYPPMEAESINFDLTDTASIKLAMDRIRHGYGNKMCLSHSFGGLL